MGNPGEEFKKTPHNLGFEVVDYLKKEWKGSKWKKKYSSLISQVEVEEKRVILVKPMTYMNLSGIAFKELMEKEENLLENTVIIYDDLSLPLGTLRFRFKGSAGGHKGMKSLLNILNSMELPRLRIGIGPKEGDATIYVLTPFSKERWEKIENIFPLISKGFSLYINDKNKAMEYFNSIKEISY